MPRYSTEFLGSIIDAVIVLAAAVLVSAALISLCGCGTIIHGQTQSLAIDSSPVGAQVQIDGSQTVKAPAIVNLDRKHSHLLVYRMAGYQDASMTTEPELSGWVFGNIVFGPLFGLVGVLVDANNGAMYSLSLDHAQATLTPLDSSRLTLLHESGLVPKLACWHGNTQVDCP